MQCMTGWRASGPFGSRISAFESSQCNSITPLDEPLYGASRQPRPRKRWAGPQAVTTGTIRSLPIMSRNEHLRFPERTTPDARRRALQDEKTLCTKANAPVSLAALQTGESSSWIHAELARTRASIPMLWAVSRQCYLAPISFKASRSRIVTEGHCEFPMVAVTLASPPENFLWWRIVPRVHTLPISSVIEGESPVVGHSNMY